MKTIKELKIGDLIYQSDAYFINIKKAKVIEKHGGYGDSYYIKYEFCDSHEIAWVTSWFDNRTEIKKDEYGGILYFSKEALVNGIDKAIIKLKTLSNEWK